VGVCWSELDERHVDGVLFCEVLEDFGGNGEFVDWNSVMYLLD
jgi:hypothetical protein